MEALELTDNRINYNGECVGIMDINTHKQIMRELGCNEHYQSLLKKPSIRIYGALYDTIRLVLYGLPPKTCAQTLIF